MCSRVDHVNIDSFDSSYYVVSVTFIVFDRFFSFTFKVSCNFLFFLRLMQLCYQVRSICISSADSDQFVNFIYSCIHMHKPAMYSKWLQSKQEIEREKSLECVYAGLQLSVLRILIAVHCDRNLHQHLRQQRQRWR